ncbi:hypothetical protein BD309DRAFT_730505 [Dichomitus squalens]|nr:hypothetical protein BD309DRAFT_730505 [Dichomitus squalens]
MHELHRMRYKFAGALCGYQNGSAREGRRRRRAWAEWPLLGEDAPASTYDCHPRGATCLSPDLQVVEGRGQCTRSTRRCQGVIARGDGGVRRIDQKVRACNRLMLRRGVSSCRGGHEHGGHVASAGLRIMALLLEHRYSIYGLVKHIPGSYRGC